MDSPLMPPEVAALLEAAMATLRAELGALPERVVAWHPAAGEWCAKEVVGHLVEAEQRGFAGRIRIILAADRPALQAWDQTEVARARALLERLSLSPNEAARHGLKVNCDGTRRTAFGLLALPGVSIGSLRAI